MAGLASLLGCDLRRSGFFGRRRAWLWCCEHAGKVIATLPGPLSALAGNVMRAWRAGSQLLPSLPGLLLIAYSFQRIHRQARELTHVQTRCIADIDIEMA